jgi:signal transduction histidine kinase
MKTEGGVSEGNESLRDTESIEEATLLAPGLIHELRHPLLGIKGGLELVARRLGGALAGVEEWDLVLKQVWRLEELLQSYESLVSPVEGAAAPFVVDDVVRRAIELLAFRLRRMGKRFVWSALPARQLARGAPNAVLHAVTNVLVNAVDAAEEASATGRVELRVLPAAEHVEVRVSDDGRGIGPEVRARLFQPRFTTKTPGKGTGLGLHIARAMMRNQGGTVRLVEDADPARLPWARTEFAVEIPAGPR